MNLIQTSSLLSAVLSATLLLCVTANAQVAVRLPDVDLDTLGISYFDDQVWLATTSGAYRLTKDGIRRIPDMDLVVYSVAKINGNLWLGTTSGAYRVTNDGGSKRIPDKDLVVLNVREVGGAPWLLTTGGAYRIDGDQAVPIVQSPAIIKTIESIDGKIWLATTNGAYRVEGNTAKRLPDKQLDVISITAAGGFVWLGTHTGAYRIAGNEVKRIPDRDLDVLDIKDIGGTVWLATRTGAYRVAGEDVVRVPDQDLVVESIELIDGKIWLATHKGIYVIEGNHVSRLVEQDMVALSVEEINGRVWIIASDGAYLVIGNNVKRVPDLELIVRKIETIDGRVWLPTNNGTYRVDDDVTISVLPQNADSLWRSVIGMVIPGNIWIAGVIKPEIRYSRVGDRSDPYPQSVSRHFGVIMETDPGQRAKAISSHSFSPAADFERTLKSGKTTIYSSVRDDWGNQFESEIQGYVVPGPAVLPALLAVVWFIAFAVAIYFAPYNTFCHDLLMNPWLRKYGSFGMVPLAMSMIPVIRNHILSRYMKTIEQDESFCEARRRFVIPAERFRPEIFGENVLLRRKLLLLGQSGLGKTAYFRFLTSTFASGFEVGPKKVRMVPVFLPLVRYQDQPIETIFQAQLANYGRLSDQDLSLWLLRQGSFLLLIDGLNEVSEKMRNLVNAFVDQHWKANCLCISSQESYPEFVGVDRESLSPLGSAEIKEILRRTLGEAKMQEATKSLDEALYDEYKIPQDLEFGIELIKQGHPLPKSKYQLYESVLAPILVGWNSEGQADYPEMLFRRAYEMLSGRQAYFDDATPPLPDALRDRLVECKFLIRRGDHYYFRHDLIRAYLAAQYFQPRWQSLLFADETTLDVNWRPMLEFSLLNNSDSDSVKQLAYGVLVKNKALAGELFKWISMTRPNLCDGWADEFRRRYGEMMLA